MEFIYYYYFSGPNRGHYITIVKSHGLWLLFDDDIVEVSTCTEEKGNHKVQQCMNLYNKHFVYLKSLRFKSFNIEFAHEVVNLDVEKFDSQLWFDGLCL